MAGHTGDDGNTVNKKGVHTSVHTSSSTKCERDGFAQRLKSARKQNNLSQKELGDAVGVSTVTIQNYENGQYPKGEYLIALSRELGCSTDWLLTGEAREDLTPREGHTKGPSRPQRRNEEQPEKRQANTENAPGHSESVTDLIWKTGKILESNTSYAWALSANIHAFYQALSSEIKPDRTQLAQGQIIKRLEELERRIQSMQGERERPSIRGRLESDELGTSEGSDEGGKGDDEEGLSWF